MNTHYKQIEKAIIYINNNLNKQPNLEDIAKHLGLSKAHFQRLFSSWAGISPKRYLQILSLNHAKELLKQSKTHVEVSLELGLSSTSRLHEHFIHLEAVTPGEYKNKGVGLNISYSLEESPFGPTFIATTSRAICNSLLFLMTLMKMNFKTSKRFGLRLVLQKINNISKH